MSSYITSPSTIWVTGISASGKTTLGQRLYDNLLEQGIENIEFFDGEELRKKLDRPYGHSREERMKVFHEMMKIFKKSSEEKNVIIVSTISHLREMREIARKDLHHFMEVYLKCPIEICAQRDYKGHYQKAFNKEYELFVGVTEPYEESVHKPELVLDTSSMSIEECLKLFVSKTLEFLHFKKY